jgi:hypothetical protein
MKTKLEKAIEIGLISAGIITGSALIAYFIAENSSPKAKEDVVFTQSEEKESAAGIGVYRNEDGDFEVGYGGKGAGLYYSEDGDIKGGFRLY